MTLEPRGDDYSTPSPPDDSASSTDLSPRENPADLGTIEACGMSERAIHIFQNATTGECRIIGGDDGGEGADRICGVSEPMIEFGAVGQQRWPEGVMATHDCGPLIEMRSSAKGQDTKKPMTPEQILNAAQSMSLEQRQFLIERLQHG